MKRFLLLLFFLNFTINVFSQIDSLDILYSKYTKSEDENRITLANNIFKYLYNQEYTDSLIVYYSNSDTCSMNLSLLNEISNYFYYNFEYNKSIFFAKKGLDLYETYNNEKYIEDYANLSNLMAISLQCLGKFADALVYQLKVYKNDSISGNLENLSSSLNNLATLYYRIKNYESSKNFCLQAIEIEKKLNRGKNMAIRYGLASEIYGSIKSLDSALMFAKLAYDIDYKEGRIANSAIRQTQMASIYYMLDSIDLAKKNLEIAIPELEKVQNLNSLSIAYNQMGNIYLKLNDLNNAYKFYLDAYNIATKIGNNNTVSKTCLSLSKVLEKSQPKKALEYLNHYVVLSDSLFQVEISNQLNQYRIKYETAQLEHENIEKENENKKIVFISITILIFMILAIIGLMLVIRAKMKAQKITNKIQNARNEFFTNITHEFRTPMTVILGLAHRLKKNEANQMDAGERIERQGERLLNLINSLLDISKIKSAIDPPKLQKGDIVGNIRFIVEGLEFSASEKHINLSFNSQQNSIITMIEPEYLQKIVVNLVSNAIKYTPEYGNVNVSTNLVDKNFTISVKDNGSGISEKNLNKIFEPYYRAENSGENIGTGIGLSLVKLCVEALGGKISVQSNNNGTNFIVNLSISEIFEEFQQDTIIENDVDIQHSENKPIVLIIEDNQDISYFIGSSIDDNYTKIFAFNGKDGYDKAVQYVPDVIISDLMMPEMDGLTLTKNIRENNIVSHIPIIIVTAKANIDDKVKGIEAGADAYLYKPFSTEELNATIKTLLLKSELLRKKYSESITKSNTNTENNDKSLVKETSSNNQETKLLPIDNEFISKLNNKIIEQMKLGRPDVESLSSEMCMSRSQLNRKIMALTGMNPTNYIINIRINIAKEMLNNNYFEPIGDIATKCGFEDVSYFSRVFKQICGITPSQFRKKE
ncbi:MAG: response regulator [Bacteroidales bacterium]|nr:response regulator [Bacteroidales bacterium]